VSEFNPYFKINVMSNTKTYSINDLKKAFEAGQNSVEIKDADTEKIFTKSFDQWLQSQINTHPSRLYREPRMKKGVMTISEFEELVEDGMITDEDGQGYWTKDGLASSDDVFDTPQLDADGVVWYNK
jgi:hypothetical protein